MTSSDVKQAYDLAIVAFHRAYAPYSQFKVGAAIKLIGSHEITFACNVENVSLGATICAERNVINQAVVRLGHTNQLTGVTKEKIHSSRDIVKPIAVEFMVVVADTQIPTMPCGMCLQCLSEFASPQTKIIIANLDQILGEFLLKDLLPNPYHTI